MGTFRVCRNAGATYKRGKRKNAIETTATSESLNIKIKGEIMDVQTKETKADWLNKQWRPLMSYAYMLITVCDFVLFPILWGILQAMTNQSVSQWQPLTLQASGFFHLTMCAVLGVSAYGRTQEKLAGIGVSADVPIIQNVTTVTTVSEKINDEAK